MTEHTTIVKYLSTATLIISSLFAGTSISQAQTTNNLPQTGFIGDGSNGNTNGQTNQNNNLSNGQSNNQNNGQSNTQQINYPAIPLSPVIQNPVNTENDFGLNLGGALNTIDGRNITLYLGIVYQPGRTDDHNARMAKLKSETQVLESQKQITQTQLQLLRQQVSEQEIRLRRMQSIEQVAPK
ncbi:hypothetical protein [Chamaesiphon sp. VAR_48_metabat_135_sub]|jgi:hypothetical protein|uniref:hypothetical protein n=1 Tax=Chamaesiphon sp. VAR_48_metabat_135_sub TaxID=2964699 RepID=UPI00286AEA71|nr:hypothetical protein [Chamaesiphon sp. VAR_48_metabat_135_sub]